MALNNTLAVISQAGCSLSFFDTVSGKKVLQVSDLTAQPHETAYDPKAKRLYISHTYLWGFYNRHGELGHVISVFDIEKQVVSRVIDILPYRGPHGVYLSHDGETLYVTVEEGFTEASGPGGIIGIDVARIGDQIVKSAGTGARSHWLTVSQGEEKAYTTNKELGFISVVDMTAGKLLRKISFPGSEEGGSSPDGRFVYYPFPVLSLTDTKPTGEFGFKVIDTVTDEVVRTVQTELPVLSAKCTARGKIVLGQFGSKVDEVSQKLVPVNGTLAVYDAQTFTLEGTIEVGLFPLTLLVDPKGDTVFVANMAAGTVDIVDLVQMSVVKTLEVDDGAGKAPNAPIHQGAHGMALID